MFDYKKLINGDLIEVQYEGEDFLTKGVVVDGKVLYFDNEGHDNLISIQKDIVKVCRNGCVTLQFRAHNVIYSKAEELENKEKLREELETLSKRIKEIKAELYED